MSIETTPPDSEVTPFLSGVEINRQTADQIITDIQATWQSAIDAGDGSAIHHEAEIKYLVDEGWRVSNLVGAHGVTEPLDTVFVNDVFDFLKASDIEKEAYGGIVTRADERSLCKTLWIACAAGIWAPKKSLPN